MGLTADSVGYGRQQTERELETEKQEGRSQGDLKPTAAEMGDGRLRETYRQTDANRQVTAGLIADSGGDERQQRETDRQTGSETETEKQAGRSQWDLQPTAADIGDSRL